MLRRFSRIATYAMVLSCCFVTYSCDGGTQIKQVEQKLEDSEKEIKDNEEEIMKLKQQISDLENETYVHNNSRPTSASRPLNIIAGHEYVDLGLSVKWATCNVGARNPEDYGNYYAWGETKTKSTYDIDNCSTQGKYIGDIAGDPSYDAATANWGGTWRMPTMAELNELKNKCRWTSATQGGHKGFKITGPNGNSIFLPNAGEIYGSLNDLAGNNYYYWSSTPYEHDTRYAYYAPFFSRNYGWDFGDRYCGMPVRPVSD